MINWKRNLFFIWIAQILSLAAFGMVVPFIPLFIHEHFGMADMEIRGIWVAAFYFSGQAGLCLATPFWGALSDRYGSKVMMLRANLVSGVIWPLMILAPAPAVLVVLRFTLGCFSGVTNAAQTLICRSTPENKQGFALGLLNSALWSGNMIGVVIGGFLINKLGFNWSFCCCGAMLFLAAALVFFFVREDVAVRSRSRDNAVKERLRRRAPRRFQLPNFSRAIWWLLGISLLFGLVRHFDNPFIAMQVEIIHGTEGAAKWTGVICSLAALAGVISGLLLGHLSDRFSAGKIVIIAVLGAGIMMFVQGAASSLTVLGIGRFGDYFFAGGIGSVLQVMLSRATPRRKRGTVFGLSASCRNIGSLAGAVTGGFVVYNLGIRWIFYTSGIIFFLLAPIFIWIFINNRQLTRSRQA